MAPPVDSFDLIISYIINSEQSPATCGVISSLKADCKMSFSEEVNDDAPIYFNEKLKKKRKRDSIIPMYAIIDKNTVSEDSTYNELNIHSEDQVSYVSMKNDEVKKSSSESLCNKRFLCLLVAIIVIIVTFGACFLLAFLQISHLKSETATVQVSQNLMLKAEFLNQQSLPPVRKHGEDLPALSSVRKHDSIYRE